MMCRLVGNVALDSRYVGRTHRKDGISFLPHKGTLVFSAIQTDETFFKSRTKSASA
jgi:hypothetical protein